MLSNDRRAGVGLILGFCAAGEEQKKQRQNRADGSSYCTTYCLFFRKGQRRMD